MHGVGDHGVHVTLRARRPFKPGMGHLRQRQHVDRDRRRYRVVVGGNPEDPGELTTLINDQTVDTREHRVIGHENGAVRRDIGQGESAFIPFVRRRVGVGVVVIHGILHRHPATSQ